MAGSSHVRWAAIAACAFLSACLLPPAFTVISMMGDGVSYVTTGRSVTDHGISVAMKEDCALFRIVKGETLCRPMKEDDPLYDLVFTSPAPAEMAGPKPNAQFLVMVPSLNNQALAEFVKNRMQPWPIALFSSQAKGQTWYHLTAGPVTDGDRPQAEAAFRRAGLTDIWSVRMELLNR